MSVPVDRALVGYVDTPVSPTDDPRRLGQVRLDPPGPFTVRESVELRLTYTVGHHGLDDRGAFKVVMRFPSDGGAWQTDDPKAPNYVTAVASRSCGFRMKYEAFGHARPWFKVLTVQVVGGCLRDGDEVVLTLGDRSQGSEGMRLQTFCEDAWELRFLVDPCATGHFVEVPDTLAVAIGPDVGHRFKVIGPTRWPRGVPFSLGVVCEDRWGNPSDQVDATLQLWAEGMDGVQMVQFSRGQRSVRLDDLVAADAGPVRWVLQQRGTPVADWRMIVSEGPEDRTYWGDLHGQSGETVGINGARSYLEFARDLAFLDITSHQGNAFQISGTFWDQLNALSAEFDVPGRFLALPGYEWSGNTAVGGDRNVYFRTEGRAIRRSSHALLLDRSDTDTDCTTATMLFEALEGEDAVAYAHVGGRWADLRQAHDGRVERAMEIHSAWGTFEWLMHDAFELGHRVGVVANSDGHKGRPGASWPGAATFGAYGGLTGFVAPELTRDAVFEAIRQRRTVATTGCRLDLIAEVRLHSPGQVFSDDPSLGPATRHASNVATMGQVVWTAAATAEVEVQVHANSPIDHVEIRVGPTTVVRHPGGPISASGPVRVRVEWAGALYRGRGRQAVWDGQLELRGAVIERVDRVNAFNPDHAFDHDATSARWEAITTGNFGGLDLWLGDVDAAAELEVHTAQGSLTVRLSELDAGGLVQPCGGLGLQLSARRMGSDNPHRGTYTTTVPVRDAGDTPVWVCVTLEDGHQAWSSPTYLIRDRP